jgi:membrane protease YdiL (CAAX protease family)
LAWPTLASGRWRAIGRSPLIIAAIVLLLCVSPFSWPPVSGDILVVAVFFATTPVVALREELAYRVLMAGSLSRLASPAIALSVSTIAFVAYHTGSQPMNLLPISAMAALGILLGVLYFRTGSWVAITVLHALVDWLVLVPRDWSPLNGLVLLGNLAMAGLALAWWRRQGPGPVAAPLGNG